MTIIKMTIWSQSCVGGLILSVPLCKSHSMFVRLLQQKISHFLSALADLHVVSWNSQAPAVNPHNETHSHLWCRQEVQKHKTIECEHETHKVNSEGRNHSKAGQSLSSKLEHQLRKHRTTTTEQPSNWGVLNDLWGNRGKAAKCVYCPTRQKTHSTKLCGPLKSAKWVKSVSLCSTAV